MLEKITFVNHLGESVRFGEEDIFVNANDLRDYRWEYAQKNNKITFFERNITEKELPVLIVCADEEQGVLLKNRLFEIMEKDVLAMKYGKIVIGDYHLNCYVMASQKSQYLISKGYLSITLTLVTEYPYWIKESKWSFGVGIQPLGGKNLDYPYDYKFDYYSGSEGQATLMNESINAVNFEITVYGKCKSPIIVINSVLYTVDAEIAAGESLKINSLTKKIYKIGYDGTITNLFNMRGRQDYIFTKIEPGRNVVLCDMSFKFEIVLIEERSEPKWI